MAEPEFLAGTLRVLILSELAKAPSYGYAIAKAIDAATGGELTVRPESLYPVLHRMEQEGLLEARWEETGEGRPRKIYRLTAKGRRRWDKTRDKFVRMMGGALRAVESAAGGAGIPGGADIPVRHRPQAGMPAPPAKNGRASGKKGGLSHEPA